MKEVWSRFDRKIVLCCTRYPDRHEEVKKELERIGLIDSAEYFWDFPSPFVSKLQSSINCTTYLSRRNAFNIFLNHYRAIKESYLRGFERVLIIEDDIRFLKSLDAISGAVKRIPDDFDIALFDRSKPYDMSLEEFRTLEGCNKFGTDFVRWYKFDHLTCAGCYALSRNGMKMLIDKFEKPVTDSTLVLRHNDYYFCHKELGSGAKLYFAFPNIAVQSILGSGSHCDMDDYWERNEACGIRMEDYNMRGTLPYVFHGNFIANVDFALSRECQKKLNVLGINPGDVIIDYWKDIKPLLNVKFSGVKHMSDDYGGLKAGKKAAAAILWGYNNGDKNRFSLSESLRSDIPVLMCEPGFISSGTTWADKNAPKKFRVEHSLVTDSKGQFFDGTRETDIEALINQPYRFLPDDIAESERLIRRIVSEKITKYNHQPIYKPTVGRPGARKVLVVDQSYGDLSIARGCANDNTFIRMLEAAISENPDADVLVKTHPDSIAGKKGKKLGYYSDINVSDYKNVYKVTIPINPYSLMEICDKVYVCSSQFGFEALMAGKEVHVFGLPWYAGWGATVDYQRCLRRTARRTVCELFYMFYMKYTHWMLPEENRMATMDEVIDKMIALRREINPQPPKMKCEQPNNSVRTEEDDENW